MTEVYEAVVNPVLAQETGGSIADLSTFINSGFDLLDSC